VILPWKAAHTSTSEGLRRLPRLGEIPHARVSCWGARPHEAPWQRARPHTDGSHSSPGYDPSDVQRLLEGFLIERVDDVFVFCPDHGCGLLVHIHIGRAWRLLQQGKDAHLPFPHSRCFGRRSLLFGADVRPFLPCCPDALSAPLSFTRRAVLVLSNC
jgi:hypothetical protein